MPSMNRRRVLKSAMFGATGPLVLSRGAGAVPQAAPSTDALDAAAARPCLDLRGFDEPVIIESFELLWKGQDYFVRVRAKNGAVGVSVPNSKVTLAHPVLIQQVFPFFIGKDARDLEGLLFGVYRHASNYKLQGLLFWCCIAWVEFAILDLLGRIGNKSYGALLGGVRRREIPFYIASSRRDSTPEEEVEHLQWLIEESGARAVKYRVGGRMSRNEDASPGRTEKLISLSRKALGDGIAIYADSNSSYDPEPAIRVGRMLEEIGAGYFEEPCPFDHLEDTKRVADALDIPVAGGEQEFSLRRFRWAIANQGVDIVQPDLQYSGGLIRASQVAHMAELTGMPTTVHISGGFGFVYMLHFASCTKDIGAHQEYKLGTERYGDWFETPIRVEDGCMSVPEGPGVGIKDVDGLLAGAKAFEA